MSDYSPGLFPFFAAAEVRDDSVPNNACLIPQAKPVLFNSSFASFKSDVMAWLIFFSCSLISWSLCDAARGDSLLSFCSSRAGWNVVYAIRRVSSRLYGLRVSEECYYL